MSLELLMDPWPTLISEARRMASDGFEARGEKLSEQLPTFASGIRYARDRAKLGNTRRAEMPVVNEDDLADLKVFLNERGYHDLCDECTVKPKNIMPTQCQIYVDKAISNTASHGVQDTTAFLMSNHLLISKDGMLIDGHHRWLSACTIDRDMDLPAFKIKQDIPDLLNLMLEFSDGRHERNV